MRKSRKFIINSLLLATFLGTASFPLTSCSSTNTTTQNSNKNNNGSTKESSNNNSTNGNSGNKQSESTSTNTVESTVSKIVNYIIDNRTGYLAGSGSLQWSSYNIYTGKYNGYQSEVYAYNPYSNKSSTEFEIQSIMEFSNYYMVAEFIFNPNYITNSEVQCQTRVYSTKPSTLKCSDQTNKRVMSSWFNVPLNFKSTSPSLLEYTIKDGYSISENTLNKNSTMLVDLGLSYLAFFMHNIGCDIRTFGFTNYTIY